jgi:peptidoglycan/LPS O-acetylase OafA/YrhL
LAKLAAAGAALGAIGYVAAAFAGGQLPRLFTHTGVFLPIYAVLVYSLAVGGGPLGRFLGWRPMLLLGEASYGLYLLHFPVFWWTEHVVALLPFGNVLLRSKFFPVLEVFAAVSLSVVVYLLFERPARRFLRRILSSGRSAAVRQDGQPAHAPVGVGALS